MLRDEAERQTSQQVKDQWAQSKIEDIQALKEKHLKTPKST